MALRLVQVNLKARDDAALGRFWAAALGWVARGGHGATSAAPKGFDWTDPDAPVCVDAIAVPDPSTVHYRAHLELATTSGAHYLQLVARLQEIGATLADVGQGDGRRTVLADPEGNEFCVLEPRELYRGTGPIGAVAVDCADPQIMARFWGEATGWTVHETTSDRALLRSANGTGPFLEFARTPHLPGARHRAHLDVVPNRGDTQQAEVARLLGLGASPADVGQRDVSWVVLTDPEGNEFCVLAPA
ncbi:VOC family protein [Dactylosporangium sp. NPDC006015]|uniref:VOC family protein n=1 Tax=Dactylosporangium sp. NPDC006015 TaxID=3154576 RepID=UPI0033A72ACF